MEKCRTRGLISAWMAYPPDAPAEQRCLEHLYINKLREHRAKIQKAWERVVELVSIRLAVLRPDFRFSKLGG